MRLRVGALVAAVCSSAIAHAGASTRLYLRASLVDGEGRAHTLELWRDGARLRRDSDRRLSLFVTHGREDRFHVVDRARGLRYDVGRHSLYRIGSFGADWRALTTLLPSGATLLSPAGAVTRTPVGSCRWRRVATAGGPQRACWSTAYGLPLAIEAQRNGTWQRLLTVEELRTGPVAASLDPPADLPTLDVDRDASPTD